MTSKTFSVNINDCFGDDYGIYFGNHYWFISGYTPVSSYHPAASAKIRCYINNLCPAGEIQVIDIGETIRFDVGYDVRVNSLNINGLNTTANITVTEVYIDPCLGVECPDCCDYENHIKYYNGICVDGQCEYLFEENSEECGYITSEPPSEPNNIVFYGTLGVAALIGLKLLSKK